MRTIVQTRLFQMLLMFPVWPLSALADQVCHNALEATTPTEDFVFQDGGVVLHRATSLVWQRCLVGQTFYDGGTPGNYGDDSCINTPTDHNWEQALQLAADDPGWRLPNIKEIASIVEERCAGPAQNQSVFIDQNDGRSAGFHELWTSSPTYCCSPPFFGISWFWETGSGDRASGNRAGLRLQVRLVRNAQ